MQEANTPFDCTQVAIYLSNTMTIFATTPSQLLCFACSNDDSCGLRSSLTFNAPSRWIFIVVQGYSGSTAGAYNISWRYT